MAGQIFDGFYRTRGDQRIVAATLAASTALTVAEGATFALVQAIGGALWYRLTGSAASSADSHRLASGETTWIAGGLTNVRIIRDDAAAQAQITYLSEKNN